MANLETGVPGTNWEKPDNPRDSKWNGQNVSLLQNEYGAWREMHVSLEYVSQAMSSQMSRADAELRDELQRAKDRVISALNVLIDDSELEIKSLLADALGAGQDDVRELALSMDRCTESPMLACVYLGRVERGARCIFCHLAHR